METHTETQRPNNGQLIYVPHKDTIRLLEVYVKRSLSLNDGTPDHKQVRSKQKWVTMPKRQRRHSSDTALHLAGGPNSREISRFSPAEPKELEKPARKSKKNKKPSFWKSILGIFSRKTGDEEQDSSPDASSEEQASDGVTTCLPVTPDASQMKKVTRRKTLRRRFSKRRLSLTKLNKPKDLIPADITRVEAVANDIQPTLYYYEKVSEELEKILHEVKEKEEEGPMSDEEVINRIIALTKEEGDAIDVKLKENPTLSSFFQGLTYSSFQKLADAYLEKEASPTHNPPTVLPTAPELVKLAFTLDFTARIAGLSRQNVGYITGLGNRYLQDRFEYQQACSDHPGSDSDD